MHLFHHPGREEIDGIGQGRFTHLWQRGDDGWKLTRIFSYDHRPYER
jgi:ketosteroid isomerase-like protein